MLSKEDFVIALSRSVKADGYYEAYKGGVAKWNRMIMLMTEAITGVDTEETEGAVLLQLLKAGGFPVE